MKSFTINEQFSDITVEKAILQQYKNLSYGSLQKAFRKRDIKLNGTRVKPDVSVNKGDIIEVYIIDEILDGNISAVSKGKDPLKKALEIIYEDKNIIIVNKPQGLAVHPDRDQKNGTLIDFIREYMLSKDEIPAKGFNASLCHRLDRNTGGLVITAKNQITLDILLDKIKNKEIKKYYLCLVSGKMPKRQDTLKDFLFKDERKSRVYVNSHKEKGSVEIITKYRVLDYNSANDYSKLEIELVTGRTHQIRAHLAYTGHPIIGDGKYGLNSINRKFGLKEQALWAYKLVFDFKNDGLEYLSNKVFTVDPPIPKL